MRIIHPHAFGQHKCVITSADLRLASSRNSQFYVSVDKKLDVKEAQSIAADRRFLGFLGAPFPTAYHLRKAGLPIYARLSEFEPVNRLFDKFTVDPLASWGVGKYVNLFKQADPNHELIVVCPSVHGHMTDGQIIEAALDYPMIKGLVTNMPKLAHEILNGADDSA